ncbi:BglG family transcription antiterminator [Agreia sp. VKM Ac-1783]|uniref:BglG family transcription antiterminator n=1 Tax=Agreia sp. VKM Ac-1783 TaxID=1938889 RepID=UPI000A2AEF7B|nr:BglG family transcription antiterminator [Agreia sp. VKM Ac-1783]SMQ71728.1 transcriptional antiterminator, BglG family [Agreia sp. VKM Ac-1783]
MNEKYERLLDYLSQADGWVTAAELADKLGVTSRSVRSYVTAAKSASHPHETIQSGVLGYRVDRDALSAFRAEGRVVEPETPRDRIYQLVRLLGNAPEGLEARSLASRLFVSDSTLEQDLRKVKLLVEADDLSLVRRDNLVSIVGSEANHRRLLSRMFREESAQGFLELERVQREFESENLGSFKTELIEMLDAHGYFVNEYGLNNVLLHLMIALERHDRAQSDVPLVAAGPRVAEIAAALSGLVVNHFDVSLSAPDLDYLAVLLTTRVVTPGHDESTTQVVENYVDADVLATVRDIVALVHQEYLIDLDDEEFMVRLSLHVRNLVARAHDNAYSVNPLTRSMKTSYPMTYELSVFIASQLQRRAGIHINDDEIAFIALHVGSYLERKQRRGDRLRCAVVCPNYYDMHEMLTERITKALGDELDVAIVITRTDVDWTELDADLVLSTIASRTPRENEVVIQPFLTDGDIENVRRAISRVRRHARRMQIKDDLLLYFDDALFFREMHASSEVEMIETLGQRMVEHGVIDRSYVDGAIERELMSSTAFTDSIAVPHAMAMTANRTSIAIVINDSAMAWGENRVNVIAFIAFAATGRTSFQEVFDQFVEVFSDREDVQRIIKRAIDFPSFIDELVHVMDK